MVTARELGRTFQDKREERKLSIDKVCKETRIHPNVVSDIERGIFDRLNKIYLTSFLKKYSNFLELDTEDILNQFENITTELSGQNFTFDVEGKAEEAKMEPIDLFTKQKVQMALVVVLSLALAILVFVFIGGFVSVFRTLLII